MHLGYYPEKISNFPLLVPKHNWSIVVFSRSSWIGQIRNAFVKDCINFTWEFFLFKLTALLTIVTHTHVIINNYLMYLVHRSSIDVKRFIRKALLILNYVEYHSLLVLQVKPFSTNCFDNLFSVSLFVLLNVCNVVDKYQ